jgi:hypothetical protein
MPHRTFFVFENEIDTHQQTRKTQAGGLSGFLYVQYTGAVTTDGTAGRPSRRLRHRSVRRRMAFERNTRGRCVPVPRRRRSSGVARRSQGHPATGAYAHFHWLGDMAASSGETRNGYLLELQAVKSFCFVHHAAAETGTCEARGGVAVRSGIDIATHLNIVTSTP